MEHQHSLFVAFFLTEMDHSGKVDFRASGCCFGLVSIDLSYEIQAAFDLAGTAATLSAPSSPRLCPASTVFAVASRVNFNYYSAPA